MQKINEVAKDPNMTAQITAERKQIQEVINLITQKYGVSIFDVYGKLGAENVREQILHARE